MERKSFGFHDTTKKQLFDKIIGWHVGALQIAPKDTSSQRGTMGQCLVQFCEHYFFINSGVRKSAPSGPCSALSACMKISSGQKLDHMYIRCSAKRERDPSTQLGAYGVQRSENHRFLLAQFRPNLPCAGNTLWQYSSLHFELFYPHR